MGDAVENLSLAMAAQYAAVSETTMRDWVKQMPGIERSSTGSYSIPKETLMSYLATKKRKVAGGSFTHSSPNPHNSITEEKFSAGALAGELIDQLRGERDHFKEEYSEAKQKIRDLEAQVLQLAKSQSAIASSLIALTHRLESKHDSGIKMERSFGEIIDAEHEPEVVMSSKIETPRATAKKKTISKAKTKTKKKTSVNTKTKIKAKPKSKTKTKVKKRR